LQKQFNDKYIYVFFDYAVKGSFFIRNNSVRNKASIKRFLLSSFETFFRSVITFPNYPCYSNGIPKKIKS